MNILVLLLSGTAVFGQAEKRPVQPARPSAQYLKARVYR